MKKQRGVEENHLIQLPPLANNVNKKKKTFYSIKKNKNTKKAYIDGSKSIGKKVGFAALFV